jgi:hypothetical protein
MSEGMGHPEPACNEVTSIPHAVLHVNDCAARQHKQVPQPMQGNMCHASHLLNVQAPLSAQQQQQLLPPISDLLPRSQRNTTSSGGYVISTAPDEVIEGFCDSLRFSEALNLDLNDTQGDGQQQQQQVRHRALRSSAGYAPTWGYASESSSEEGGQHTTCVAVQHNAAYSDSSNDSSPLVSRNDAAPAGRSVRSCHPQQLSFLGAFDHLETAAQGTVAAAAEGEAQAEPDREFSLSLQQQLLRRSSAGGIGRGEPVRASFSALAGSSSAILAESSQQQQQQQQEQIEQPELEGSPAPAPAATRRTTAGDHVVTWYSAVGGSIDFGSPEPPSPQGEESFIATAMLRAAGRSAAARMAAAAAHEDAAAVCEGVALQYDSDEDEADDPHAGSAEAAAVALAAEASAAASSSSSSRQRWRWDRSSQQQQQQLEPGVLFEVQQAQQQQQDVEDAEDEEALPRWVTRPSWAAAGLGGYRWVFSYHSQPQRQLMLDVGCHLSFDMSFDMFLHGLLLVCVAAGGSRVV